MNYFVLIFISILLGGIRVAGVTHIAFQALAHLFVGVLFGGWLVNKDKRLIVLLILLTLLETVCFFYFQNS